MFVTDDELIELLGVPDDIGRTAIATLERDDEDFPRKIKREGDRRNWTAVRAYLDYKYGATKTRPAPPPKPKKYFKSRDDLRVALGMTAPHFFLLLESGSFPPPKTRRGKLIWELVRYQDRMEQFGEVYFIRFGNLIKIGYSMNVPRRHGELQRKHGEEGELLFTLAGDENFEHHIHETMRADWRHEEYFWDTQDLRVFIDKLRGAR
jgi:hypothetical protein